MLLRNTFWQTLLMPYIKDINSTRINLIELIKKNIEHKVIDNHFLGDVIEISPKDAFEMSAVIGSNYLFNPAGYTMKGRNETFIHRTIFQNGAYTYSPGLFERDLEMKIVSCNGVHSVKRKYPNLFKVNIKLVFKIIKRGESSNVEEKIYEEIINNKEDPSSYMIIKLFDSAGFEPVLEYLSFKNFNKNSYLFENQVPFFQQNFEYKNKRVSGGIPDVCFIRTPELNELYKCKLAPANENIIINSLPFLSEFPFSKDTDHITSSIEDFEVVLGEVKSSSSSLKQARLQMDKYSFVEFASDIFSFIPDYRSNNKDIYSSMFIEGDNIKYKNKYSGVVNPDFTRKDRVYTETTIKMNLLAGARFEVINEVICCFQKISSKEGFYSYHLIDFCLRNPLEEIITILDQ
jgi:hypothetical protein